MDMVTHNTIAQHIHPSKERLLKKKTREDLFLLIAKNKRLIRRAAHNMVNRRSISE